MTIKQPKNKSTQLQLKDCLIYNISKALPMISKKNLCEVSQQNLPMNKKRQKKQNKKDMEPLSQAPISSRTRSKQCSSSCISIDNKPQHTIEEQQSDVYYIPEETKLKTISKNGATKTNRLKKKEITKIINELESQQIEQTVTEVTAKIEHDTIEEQLLKYFQIYNPEKTTYQYDIQYGLKRTYEDLINKIKEIENTSVHQIEFSSNYSDYFGNSKHYLINIFHRMFNINRLCKYLDFLHYNEEKFYITIVQRLFNKINIFKSSIQSCDFKKLIVKYQNNPNNTQERNQLYCRRYIIRFLKKQLQSILIIYIVTDLFVTRFSQLINQEKMNKTFNLIVNNYDTFLVTPEEIHEKTIFKLLRYNNKNAIQKYLQGIYRKIILIEQNITDNNTSLESIIANMENLLYRNFSKFIQYIFCYDKQSKFMMRSISSANRSDVVNLLKELLLKINILYPKNCSYITIYYDTKDCEKKLKLHSKEVCAEHLYYLTKIVIHVYNVIDQFIDSVEIEHVNRLFDTMCQYKQIKQLLNPKKGKQSQYKRAKYT